MNVSSPRVRRASALVLTLLLAIMLMVITHSLLSRVGTEKRITVSHLDMLRANNALDANLDYAIGQIVARKRYAAADGETAYTPKGIRALGSLPVGVYDSRYAGISELDFSLHEVVGSNVVAIKNQDPKDAMAKINDGKWYIDPNSIANAGDSMKGQYVDRFLVGVLATGAVKSAGGSKVAHGVTFLERRDAHLFNYAVFFSANPVRIITPGGLIQVGGAVVANQGLFFRTQGDSDIRFLGTVASASGIWDRNPSAITLDANNTWDLTSATVKDTSMGKTGRVRFANPAGVLTSLYDSERGSDPAPWWLTTPSVDFKNRITNFTTGAIQTADHGVQTISPIGTSTGVGLTLVQDPSGREGLFDRLEKLNRTEKGITPVYTAGEYNLDAERAIDAVRTGILDVDLSTVTDPAQSDLLAKAREIEQNKLALKASIYAVVERDGSVTAFNNPDQAIAYKKVSASARASWRTANRADILDLSPYLSTPQLQKRTTTDAAGATVELKSTPTNTLYDRKQNGTVTVVELDVGKLRDAIGDADSDGSVTYADGKVWNTRNSAVQRGAKYANAESKQGWNGVIYFDVEAPLQKFDGIPSLKEWKTGVGSGEALADTGYTAIRVANAEQVPAAKVGDSGFTLATNAPVYIKGSFNADGKEDTGTSSLQDDQSKGTDGSKALAASIWADFTVIQDKDFQDLSNLTVTKPAKAPAGLNDADIADGAWPFTDKLYRFSSDTETTAASSEFTYSKQLNGKYLEISAAIVSGERAGKDRTHDYPTGNGLQSFIGYMENYNRNNCGFRVRGSLVNLWQPRVFAGNFINPDFYWNPTRDYGYSSLFARGVMPPGTPAIREYKKVRFMEVSRDVYLQLKGETSPLRWAESLLAAGK